MLQRIKKNLARFKTDIELIDLSSISPIDFETIFQSVRQTGRCLIVHEAPKHCGVGAEIAASLAEHCFSSLKSPVARITGFDTIVPPAQFEDSYLPSYERINRAMEEMLA